VNHLSQAAETREVLQLKSPLFLFSVDFCCSSTASSVIVIPALVFV
jgi:hypothetical protein